MSDDHECDFPDTCQVCTPKVRKPRDEIDYSFTATFTSNCRKCGDAIHAGQVAVRMKPLGDIVCDVCSGSADMLEGL